MISLFTASDGQTYRAQTELARGGEGIILTVAGRTDVVVKRYLDGQATPERAAKLKAMLADPPRDEMRERFKHASITWPLAILHEGGRFAGFLMPRIDGGSSLLNAYNPRARGFLGLDWSGQHHVAKNLCTALHALHLKGYVMGDVNQRNILVTAQGLVTLVDTDSFQVRADGTLYRCPVGVPEYTPRELQGQRFDQVDRTPEHDRFGLAVLLFQLLMDGYHPFAGAPTNPDRSVGKVDEWCIRNGVFPWRPHPDFGKPRAARPLEALAPGLQDLFIRCFVNGHAAPSLRPAPKEWLDALHAAQQELVRCPAGAHWCHPAGGACHACQARQRKSGAARTQNQTQAGVQARTAPPPVRATPPSPIRPIPPLPIRPIPPPPVQPTPAPARQSPPVVRPRWRRAHVAAAFGVLALLVLGVVLGPLLYRQWNNSPTRLIARAGEALNGGDEAAAEALLRQAAGPAPDLVLAFARDRADLYRALASGATASETALRGLALAEAAQWHKTAKSMAKAVANTPRQRAIDSIAAGMVDIPGGTFQMGCVPGKYACAGDALPVHDVKVQPFRMGKYEVTQAQWSAVMNDNPARFGGNDRPVENVSWNDSLEFLKRLNADSNGKPYRLPSEAEWEYAARAGTRTAYWWGEEVGKGNANCDDCGSPWDYKETAPVGSFKPNALGLYDTVGNVLEWVQDCYHGDYTGAPADGSGWRGSCPSGSRTLRGGSWGTDAGGSSLRYVHDPGLRSSGIGLRLAQDL